MRKRMKNMLMFALVAVLVLSLPVPVHAAEISPCLSQSARVNLALGFDDNIAKCQINVICPNGQVKITGTAKLYDETAKKTVTSWSFSTSSSRYTGTKEIPVQSGHTYTLSVSGKVTDADGNSESISGSVTKKNS